MDTYDFTDIFNNEIDKLLTPMMQICERHGIPSFVCFNVKRGENNLMRLGGHINKDDERHDRLIETFMSLINADKNKKSVTVMIGLDQADLFDVLKALKMQPESVRRL